MQFRIPILAAVSATLALTSPAQTTSIEAMTAARSLRQELALAVSQSAQSSSKALALLRGNKGASGRAGSSDADFAYAALDVGYRLMALERPEAAEDFFRAAELSFAAELNRTAQARGRAELLHQLAILRGRFLGKIAQAKADMDEAVRLQPNDVGLREARAGLARGRGEFFKSNGKN